MRTLNDLTDEKRVAVNKAGVAGYFLDVPPVIGSQLNNFTIDMLDGLTAEEVAGLPMAALADLQTDLGAAKLELALRHEKLWQALDHRFGKRVRALLLAARKDTGTEHIIEDGYDLQAEIKKSVSWDTGKLASIFEDMSEKDAQHYAKVKLSVAEAKYLGAPPEVREKLETARVVKPGKTDFTIKPIDEKSRRAA